VVPAAFSLTFASQDVRMLGSRSVAVFPRVPVTALVRSDKIRRNLPGLSVILAYNEKRPGNPPCGEPAGPCFSNFVVPRFAG
jgi:hypothetical protein